MEDFLRKSIEKYVYSIDNYRIVNATDAYHQEKDWFDLLDGLFVNKNFTYDELLKELTNNLSVDASFVFSFSTNYDFATKEFEYYPSGYKPFFKPMKNHYIKAILPLLDLFIEKNFVYIPDINRMKIESKLIKKYKEIALKHNIQSILFFPIFDSNEGLKGVIGFLNETNYDLDKTELIYINYFLSIIKNFFQKDIINIKYEAIFESTQTGFLLLDINGRIVEINKRAARYFGYSEKELLNQYYEKYIHEDSLAKMQCYFKNRTLVDDLPKEYLTNIICKGNSTKIVKVSVILLENNQRIMVLTDQTKLIKEKKRLDELMNRYKSLFKNNSSIMLLINLETGFIVDANKAALDFYGYDFESITQKNISDIFLFQNGAMAEMIGNVIHINKKSFNAKHRLSNGDLRDVEVYIGPIEVESKMYLYSITHDITEKKEFKKALNLEKKFTQTLIDTANAIILTTDKDFKTTSINKYFEELTGIKRSEMIGKDTIEFLTSIHERERVHDTFKKIFRGEANSVYSEHTLTLDNGHNFYIAWKDSLLKDDDFEDQILSVGIDITEKKISEEKLRYKYELEKSLNKVRDIIASGITEYTEISKVIADTIKIDRIEIVEFESKLNNDRRKVFEYTLDKDHELIDSIESYSEESVRKLKAYLLKKESIIIHDTSRFEDFPELDDFIKENHLKSFVTIPFVLKEKIYGSISFNIFESSDYYWNEDELKYLIQLGEIVNHAMIRRIQLKYTERTFKNAVNTLSSVVEMKDAYTASHQLKVAALAVAIAKKMDLDQGTINTINVAAKLHDIGKINVPGVILSKPGKISEIELLLVKEHSEYSFKILEKIDFEEPIAEIVHQHHERLDGSGYPKGLNGDQIRLEARIIAVADVVEAMMSHRPYRKAKGIKKALEEINKFSGVKYDETVVKTCVELFEKDRYKIPTFESYNF